MKKLMFTFICLTLLLSACGNETREPEETDLLETMAETLSKNVEEPDDDTVYPWLDLTEFAEENYRPADVIPAGGNSVIVTFESDNKSNVQDRYNSAEYADYISCIDLTEKKELYRIDAPVTVYFNFMSTLKMTENLFVQFLVFSVRIRRLKAHLLSNSVPMVNISLRKIWEKKISLIAGARERYRIITEVFPMRLTAVR